MSIIFILFSFLTISVFAHSVPKNTRAYSQAKHRSTMHVYKRKGIPHSTGVQFQTPGARRGIASERVEKVEKIPWKTKR